VRVLIVTDSFPPACGGSGWSTYELARGLRSRGHELIVVQPRPGQRGSAARAYDGFTIREQGSLAPPVPYVRNYFKNERLYARLARTLGDLLAAGGVDVVHAQHVLTTPPAVRAARAAGVPVVCTVRDYWPVCYWSDLLLDPDAGILCPGCTVSRMTACVRPRAGALWPLALPMIPYMRQNLATKANSLTRADAVVAVASRIARDLGERVPGLQPDRLHVVPNPVDVEALDRDAAQAARRLEGPYALYVGKLAPNKGVGKLWSALSVADLPWPLVIVGDGPDRRALEAQAVASGRTVRFTGWLSRTDVLGWMKHASVLAFPSHGPESLSRVLLESAALGVPIAAMDTGGTRDIIRDEVTGLLAKTPEELGAALGRLARDPALAARVGRAARELVRTTFDTARVVERMEALYQSLAGTRSRTGAGSGR
jgi:glycosyltransferase involved in cell wall biosynthesis